VHVRTRMDLTLGGSERGSSVRAGQVLYRGTSLIKRIPPLGPPQGPRKSPTVGSWERAGSPERGTPVYNRRALVAFIFSRARAASLSDIMYLLIRFKKSNSHQSRQLVVLFGNRKQ
jgi:hypothetical protein